MGQAHSVNKNNYLKNTKDHSIFTPAPICDWLKEVLQPELGNVKTVFDPAVGSGNLLKPFNELMTIGADVEDYGAEIDMFEQGDFLDWKKEDYSGIDLVLANPPYNHTDESRKKWGKSTLLPELFADHVFKLFGKDQKLVLFTPMGLRLNTRCKNKKQGERYKNIRDNWGQITSIVSMPLDVFHNPNFDPNFPEGVKLSKAQFKHKYPGLDIESPEVQNNPLKYRIKSNLQRIETQQEILFFNMPNIPPHLSLPESVIEQLREEDKELWG